MENKNVNRSVIMNTQSEEAENNQGRVTVHKGRKKNKTPLPVSIMLVIAALSTLLVFIIMNFAEIDRYNADIAELRDQLTELQKESGKLRARLDKKNDLVYVEEYATEELGMVKASGLTRINITALPENGGETYNYDDGEEGGLGVLLAGLGEVIKDFFRPRS